MSRLLKIAAAVIAVSVAVPSGAFAQRPAGNSFLGNSFLGTQFKPPPPGTVFKAPQKFQARPNQTTPETILAEQIANAIAALPGTPTQAQIKAAIDGVLATSTATPQQKQTALAVVQASVGPTSPIALAAGSSATTLTVTTGAPAVAPGSAAVQTLVNIVNVKAEIVVTLSGVSGNLANSGTPSNSDYRAG
jgi:hypothetical protein